MAENIEDPSVSLIMRSVYLHMREDIEFNDSSESLLEFIVSSDIERCKRGNETTFVMAQGQELLRYHFYLI